MSQWLVQCAKLIELLLALKVLGAEQKISMQIKHSHKAVHRYKDYQNTYAHALHELM